MKHGKNSRKDRAFVNPPPKKNEISTLVIDRNPSEFALYLTNGGPVWTIFPVTDGDGNVVKKTKDTIDKGR